MPVMITAMSRSPHESLADALAAAQRALLRMPKYHHPYYWAPYILSGERHRPLTF